MSNKSSKTNTVNALTNNLIERLSTASSQLDVQDRMRIGLALGIGEVTVQRYLKNKVKMMDLEQAELIAIEAEKILQQKGETLVAKAG